MNNEPQQAPWYKRPLPLPGWLPGWLFATLLAGAISTLAFNAGLRDWSWGGVFGWFAAGAGFVLATLSLTALRLKPGQERPSFLPPIWVRHPVLISLLVFISLIWITDRRITTGARHGSHPIVEGPAAVAAGVLLMAVGATGSYLIMRREPRSAPRTAAGIAGLAIIAAGLIFAAVRIAQSLG